MFDKRKDWNKIVSYIYKVQFFHLYTLTKEEQNKTLFSICVTPDIKWTIPGSR